MGFSGFRDAGREDCFCSEQDHPEFPIQEEGQSRGTARSERGPVSTRKTDDRLHVLRLILSDWCSWYSIGLHFHRKLKQFFFLEEEVLFAYAVTVSGAGRIIFKAVERLQFLTWVELLFFHDVQFSQFVMSTLLSIRNHSTILEGQRLGTVHILEGTCSQA